MEADHTIDRAGSYVVETPDGLVIISSLPTIGTQVMVYTDPNRSPIGYISIKEDS